jgi:WS/DGAT/MGAT family acyltransferase
MASAAYERLSAQDRSFFLFEGPSTPMHVGGLAVFELGGLATAEGGLDAGRIAKHVEARLQRQPRYRRRLAHGPGRSAIWVDDERFDIAYHVRHTCLPRPGTPTQLKALAGRLMEQPLDRARPLWEMWLVEGIEGARFGIFYKIHHSMVDGASGVNLLTHLFSPTPDEKTEPAPAWRPTPAPSPLRLLADEALRGARALASAGGAVGEALASPRRALRGAIERAGAVAAAARAGVRIPARTPLNLPIGRHRRVDWFACELERVRALRRRLDGTVNDVVLAVVAGALRRYLGERGAELQGSDFRVVVPVNMRPASDDFSAANRVSALMLSLPLDEPDPRRRFEYVRRETQRQKRSHAADGIALFTDLVDQANARLLLRLGVELAARLHPYNLIVSNVHGPDAPLYLLGSRLLETYAHLPLFEHQGLGVVTVSYDGRMFWSLVGDRELASDLPRFVAAIAASIAELEEVGGAS